MIYFDEQLHKIQEVRTLHAIAETDFPICVSQEDAYKLQPLQKYFKMHFEVGNCHGHKFSQVTNINHSKPVTSIGNIERTLIFPHAITNHLHLMWKEKRKYKYSFAGLVTLERKNIIENWIKTKINNKNYKLPDSDTPNKSFINKIKALLNIQENNIKQYGKFYFWASSRGRSFPIKTWDVEYYNFLVNSEFVLCPSGDFVWSYRFFESILCGAIPVIEEYCDVYSGFKFKYMSDNPNDLVWNKEDIEHNYNLCLKRITISEEEILLELAKFKNN
jgi:hypothetical protein